MTTIVEAQVQTRQLLTLLDNIAQTTVTPATVDWPTAHDCLGGPVPVPTAILPKDYSYVASRLTHIDRAQGGVPAGAIPFIGDSITEDMCVVDIHPACLNFGIASDTLRNVMGHIDKPMMHRAGAMIVMIGINDLEYETQFADATNAMANVLIIWRDRLLPWITGKCIVCAVTPVDESKPGYVTNATINAVNAQLETMCANKSNVVFVNANAELAPNGQLAYGIGDRWHIDSVGQAILKRHIRDAAISLGLF